MNTLLRRILLAASAALLAFGAVVHTLAFKKLAGAVNASGLPAFYGKAFKSLWLIDSATLMIVAIVFGFLAIRPTAVPGFIIVLVALIPAATAALLYYFVGAFMPAHMCLLAAALATFAGVMRAGKS
jgi:uncharacterized membrane protein